VYHDEPKNGKARFPASPATLLRMSTDIERPIACAALAAALILGTASAAAAQAMPGPRGPVGPGIAAGALARAYQAIGEAEAVNGRSVYVGQAREH
jgi:hypothetical protein